MMTPISKIYGTVLNSLDSCILSQHETRGFASNFKTGSCPFFESYPVFRTLLLFNHVFAENIEMNPGEAFR